MPDFERIQRGRDFEKRVRDVLGAKLVSRSGAGWKEKSDVHGRLLRVSVKAETNKSWNRLREQLFEAIDFSIGTGETPALAVLDDDESAFIIMRLEDFSALLASDTKLEPAKSRGDVVRQAAEVPSLLR